MDVIFCGKGSETSVWEDFLANLPLPAPNLNDRLREVLISCLHFMKDCVRLRAYSLRIKINDSRLRLRMLT